MDLENYLFGSHEHCEEREFPLVSPHRLCNVCGLHFVSDKDSENLVAALSHLARQHAREFAEVAGFWPEQDVMDHIYYMVREGMFRTDPQTGRLERVFGA